MGVFQIANYTRDILKFVALIFIIIIKIYNGIIISLFKKNMI